MRILTSVSILLGFQILLACGGEEPSRTTSHALASADTTPADAPSPASSASPPADTTTTTPAPSATASGSVLHVKNDIDDADADAYCAARAKAAPPGAFTADSTLPLSGANGVVADDSSDTQLHLVFSWPASLTTDDGQPWRDWHWMDLAIAVPSIAGLAAGSSLDVALSDFQPMDDSCTTQVVESDMTGCGSYSSSELSPNSRLTITSRSATSIEGALDVAVGTSVSHLTFRAPFTSSLPADNGICCLKQR